MRIAEFCKAALVIAPVLAGATEAHALAYWCHMNDWSRKQAFLSDIKPVGKLTSRQLRAVASRFRRTVNIRYDTFYGIDAATCSLYSSQSKATLARSAQTVELQRQGFSLFTVDVF